MRLQRLVRVWTCQNATLLEISCTGSIHLWDKAIRAYQDQMLQNVGLDQGHSAASDLDLLCFISECSVEIKVLLNSFPASGRERSGSVVECLTRDRGATGSSLTGNTALWSLSKTHLS